MKLRDAYYYSKEQQREIDLKHAVANNLVDDDSGISERANRTACAVAEAFGILVETLHNNGHLSREQALSFVNTYRWKPSDDDAV